MDTNTATANSKVIFKILEPNIFTIGIEVPAASFLASIIIDIFSGISGAMVLIIMARMGIEIPISKETSSRECMKGCIEKYSYVTNYKNHNGL